MNKKICLVVGASRSGTTMMGRLIGSLGGGYCLPELHFFELFANIGRLDKSLSLSEKTSAITFLISACENGYLNATRPVDQSSVAEVLEALPEESDYIQTYVVTLVWFMDSRNLDYLVDQTPRNIFFYQVLQNRYPDIFCVVNMIRDPRAVLFSYRSKWLQSRLGVEGFEKKEIFRTRVSYDPIVTSYLWRSAVRQSAQNSKKYLNVYYERMVSEPKKFLVEISQKFELGCVDNAQIALDKIELQNSSFSYEGESKGVSTNSINRWSGIQGLSSHELRICEYICKAEMLNNNYTRSVEKYDFKVLFSMVLQLIPTFTRGILMVAVNWRRSKTPLRSMLLRLFGRV